MSWQINSTGNKRGVRREVQEATSIDDQAQLNIAKQFINAELDAMPDGVGIKVEAYGHRAGATLNIYIKIDQVRLAVDAATPTRTE